MTQDSSAPNGFANSLKLDCTTADTSIGSAEVTILRYSFEGQDVQQFKKGTSDAEKVTVSFFVKGNASATYTCELQDNTNGRTIAQEFSVTTSFTRVILTFNADTSGTITNDNAERFRFHIFLHGGSNYTGGTFVSNTWASTTTNQRIGDNQTSFFDSTDRTFFLTGLQMEVGSQATPFEHRSFGEELLLCQRYFQLISGGAVMPNGSTGIEGSVTRQEMRAATSISVTAAMKVEDPSVTTYTQSSASATISNADKFAEKFTLQNFSGLNTQRPYFLKNPQDGGGQIELDAEL
jgi:hypothetical protein